MRPPEQVQAAFDDVLKAGQERERAKNEGQAYANDVIPRAGFGGAPEPGSRGLQVAHRRRRPRAMHSASSRLLAEYQRAPQVTRDRLYLDTMQQIYSSVTKVLIDSRQGASLLYLPLDKMHAAGAPGRRRPPAAPPAALHRRAARLRRRRRPHARQPAQPRARRSLSRRRTT